MLNEQAYRENWISPVHKIGRWTLSLVCVTSLFPVAYRYFGYGVFPPMDWIWKDLLLITAGFGLIWVIEPLTFYPALGLSGCYLAFISGNMSQETAANRLDCRRFSFIAARGVGGTVAPPAFPCTLFHGVARPGGGNHRAENGGGRAIAFRRHKGFAAALCRCFADV